MTGIPAADDATGSPAPHSPYLIIQRQFETPDGRLCHVETHDQDFIGDYRLRLIDFDPIRLAIEIERKTNRYVEVSCSSDAVEFNELRHILHIIVDRRG